MLGLLAGLKEMTKRIWKPRRFIIGEHNPGLNSNAGGAFLKPTKVPESYLSCYKGVSINLLSEF